MSTDFQKYLQSVCDAYQHWWSLYTITDVEGPKTAQHKSVPSLFGFDLMVQTVQPQQPDKGETPEKTEKTERLPVQEGLRKYAVNHVLLVGRPGSGKSTALARLLLEEAGNSVIASEAKRNEAISSTTKSVIASAAKRNEAISPTTAIPILVELRQYNTSVLELIQNFLLRHDPNLTFDSEILKTWLRQGQLLLLLDGVNELPTDDARRDLKTFRHNYPNTPMIFTTRDLGVGGDLGIEKKLEMQRLRKGQMQQFVRAYLPEQGEEMLQRLGGRLREFGQTPLLLWMLCELFRTTGNVPPNLGLVFRYFANSYDGKIKDDVPVSGESRRWWQELLQHLAFAMMHGETRTELRVTIERREAEALFTKFLEGKVDYPASRAKEWLEDLLKHHLIQVASNNQIEFRHQLLQEYYAAECLLQQLPNISNEKLKRDYLNYLKWTEPLALMLALVEKEAQAVRVVELALDVDLQLGARLAGEVKREFQEKTVSLILELEVPELLKIEFLTITRSGCKQAIAFLSHRLLQHEDYYVRRTAASALRNIKDSQAVQALIQALNHEDSHVRSSAACALGEVKDSQAVQALIQALNHEDSHVRSSAACALTEIKFYHKLEVWMIPFHQDDYYVRKRAASVSGEIGNIKDSQAVQALIIALKAQDSHVRRGAVSALTEIKDSQAVQALIIALNHEDSHVRRGAASAFRNIKDSQAVQALIIALNHEDFDVRRGAAYALGKIKDSQAVPALIIALNDQDFDVRGRAAYALGKIKDSQAVPALIIALNDEVFSVRERAAYALGKIKDSQAVQALIIALNEQNYYVRRGAAYALGEIKDSQAVPALIQALNHQDYDVRRSAADPLGEIGDSEILSQMWELRLTRVYDAESVILKIQERCKFYNHEIFHSPPVEEENQSNPLLDTLNKLNRTMSETPRNDFSNATFGNITGSVTGNIQGHNIGTQQNYAPEQKQNLVEAAKEIQQLLNHLSVTYPTSTESQKQAIANQAIAHIKRDNPTTWQRLRSATEAALIEAFKEVLDNPFVNVTVAAVEGYRKAE